MSHIKGASKSVDRLHFDFFSSSSSSKRRVQWRLVSCRDDSHPPRGQRSSPKPRPRLTAACD
jgi:hypothetical protein